MSFRAEPGQMPVTPTEIAAAVAAERRHLADHVEDLSENQWETPSLCEAWTVRDVIAHLGTTTRLTVPKVDAGEGPELRGPDEDLLLVAAGRPAGLAALDGPGLEVVSARLGGG